MSYLFCFGLGYSARALAHRLRQRGCGFHIAGTAQPREQAMVLSDSGEEAYPVVSFDRNHPINPTRFADATHILVSIPPDASGDPVVDIHGADLVRANLVWVGYLSTTGVYGNTGGAWVDETTPLKPSVYRSIARVAAEQAWLALWTQCGLPVHIFRLAGIYGPGHSAIDALRSGRAHRVIKPGQVFSRVHVEDLARVLEVSMSQPNPGSVYNVCDDEPGPPQDIVVYAATLLGQEPPPALDWEKAQQVLSPMALTFYADNRRVRNDRIKYELGITLRYPTYREGLADCV